MKTRILTFAAVIIFSVTLASAGTKQHTLIFHDALGRTLTLPMMAEEPEAIPFDTTAEFSRIRANDPCNGFDISQMMKPEEEEELPFDLDAVLQTIK